MLPRAWIVVFMLLAGPTAVEAQQTKVSRVGLLGIGSDEQSPFFEVFRQELRERGWVEGQNIVFEDRSRVEGYQRLPDVAAELVRLKADVIVTTNTTGAIAVKKATATIPIVTMMGTDPVQVGLVASLARPGGNVTDVADLAAKHRLPAIFDSRAYVEAGGLMSYGSDTKAIYRGLAGYVDRILKGARPGDLPIEQPTKIDLVINLKAAKALGLAIPPAVLARADEVIQ